MRRTTALPLFLFLFLLAPSAPAGAQARCYPPPCVVEVSAELVTPSAPSPIPGGDIVSARSDDRSPVPIVLLGLLAVAGSLTAVALRRRGHILRRTMPERRVSPGPIVATPAPQEPQAALR